MGARPGPGHAQGARSAPGSPSPSSTWSSSTRPSPPRPSPACASWGSTRRGSTSTAARSPSATRWAASGARLVDTLVHELRAPRGRAAAWRRCASASARASPPCSSGHERSPRPTTTGRTTAAASGPRRTRSRTRLGPLAMTLQLAERQAAGGPACRRPPISRSRGLRSGGSPAWSTISMDLTRADLDQLAFRPPPAIWPRWSTRRSRSSGVATRRGDAALPAAAAARRSSTPRASSRC